MFAWNPTSAKIGSEGIVQFINLYNVFLDGNAKRGSIRVENESNIALIIG